MVVVVVTVQLAVYDRVGSTPGMSNPSVTQELLSCDPPDFLELYLHLILSPFASAGAEYVSDELAVTSSSFFNSVQLEPPSVEYSTL